MNATQVDFQQIRIKHILFKSKVRSVLYGGKKDNAFFALEGPINTWFNTIGLIRYGETSEMRALAAVQKELNATAALLFSLYDSGKIEQSLQGLEQVEANSVQFLKLLNQLEEKLKDK
ncbi:histidine kinase [Pontibacter qinzhouensis]|uniref:Histidine kinase n=1 Tax=Pontibacter qinzhouensis TaxID=2603253 RepID=A0A5C8KE36_9BACT|nr:histidine kinase [Pontibacter qinzhouensis]TXK51580.1 histidine kinase [Pontibacter qinzhouensis]